MEAGQWERCGKDKAVATVRGELRERFRAAGFWWWEGKCRRQGWRGSQELDHRASRTALLCGLGPVAPCLCVPVASSEKKEVASRDPGA